MGRALLALVAVSQERGGGEGVLPAILRLKTVGEIITIW